MTTRSKYDFRQVTVDDVPILFAWRAQPLVREWWGTDEPYDQETISDLRISRSIVSYEGRPFAYLQDYAVHGWEDHHFTHLPVL